MPSVFDKFYSAQYYPLILVVFEIRFVVSHPPTLVVCLSSTHNTSVLLEAN
jgi:hypothetical protein